MFKTVDGLREHIAIQQKRLSHINTQCHTESAHSLLSSSTQECKCMADPSAVQPGLERALDRSCGMLSWLHKVRMGMVLMFNSVWIVS